MSVPGTVNFPTSLDDAISLFQTANRISTTLNGGISNSAVSIVLTSGTGWPNSGSISFIDTGEIAYYTGKSTNTLTGCIRGQDGTAAAAHSNGIVVQLNDTSNHHQVHSLSIIAIQTKIGTGSSTPTSGLYLRGSGAGTSAWSAIQSADVPNISAALLTSGTLSGSVFPATLPAVSGVNLTNLNASNLASGTVPLARLSGITNTEIAAGAGIVDTKLATISSAGKVSDSALSSNIPLKNGANVFTSTNQFSNIGVENTATAAARGVNLIKTGINQTTLAAEYRGLDIEVSGGLGTSGEHLTSAYLRTTATSNMGATGGPVGINTVATVNSGISTDQLQVVSLQGAINGSVGEAWSTYEQLVTFTGGAITTSGIGAFHDLASVGTGSFNNPTIFKGQIRSLSSGILTGTAKGIDLSGWSGSIPTSYGIFADASIDIGTTRFFIKSTSTSPSELTGNFTTFGLLKAGTTPVTLTDAAGKILSVALNTVAVAQGGTGQSSLTAYGVLCAGTTSTGALQQVSGTGTTGQVLTSNGTAALPTWQNNSAGFSDPMTSIGDIIYRNASNVTTRLPIGVTAQVLTVSGGVPVWSNVPGGGGGGGSPAGSGTELQYRFDATTFGAVPNTSISAGAIGQGIGGANPFTPPNLVGTQTVKWGTAGSYADSTSGDLRQFSSWLENTGTRNSVAGTFGAKASGAGQVWALNPYAYANHASGIAQAMEFDFGTLVSGGVSYGITGVYTGTQNSAGAFLHLTTAAGGGKPLYGITFANIGTDPFQSSGTLIRTTGTVTVANGIDFSTAAISGDLLYGPNNSGISFKRTGGTAQQVFYFDNTDSLILNRSSLVGGGASHVVVGIGTSKQFQVRNHSNAAILSIEESTGATTLNPAANNYGVSIISGGSIGTSFGAFINAGTNSTDSAILVQQIGTGIQSFRVDGYGIITQKIDNATTNAVDTLFDIQHSSSGSVAAGFGSRIRFGLESTTTANQDAAAIDASWSTATHGSRTADLIFSLVNNATAIAEVARFRGSDGFLVFPHTKGIAANGGGQNLVVNAGSTGTVSIGDNVALKGANGGQTVLATSNRGNIQITSATITEAGYPFVDISGTWNAGGVTQDGIKLNVTNTASAAGSKLLDLQIGSTSIFKVDKTGLTTWALDNATTAAVDDILDIQHSSSGTPAANFGTGIRFGLESSTTTNQDAVRLSAIWTTATHASRTSALLFNTVANGAAIAERFRIEVNSSNTDVKNTQTGINGETRVTGVIEENVTLSTSGATTDTTIDLPANSLIDAVTIRITTTITGINSTSLQWGDPTTAARFGSVATFTSGTTGVGITQWNGNITTTAAGPTQASAAKVRLTLTGGADNTPSAGAVRVAIFYRTFAAPTA